MKLHPLGTTKLYVTPLGLGLAALGRPGYINLGHADDLEGRYEVPVMEARAHAVLDAAWQAGIRYFDAARSYGQAEAFLASWLKARDLSPDAVSVGSKWGYTYTAGWRVDAEVHEVKEHTLPVLQQQWQESRALLGAYVRLYQIHSATPASGVLDNQDVLAELANLKHDGVAIGLSVSGPQQAEVLRRALCIEIDGVRLFDSVQATWNLLEPAAGPVLYEVHRNGLGVIVKEALANGRQTPRNTDPAFANAMVLLRRQAARLGTTLDALALAAALAQPWADVVLSGAATVDHLWSNSKATDVAWDDEAAHALAGIAESSEVYWRRRGSMAWT